ncbi:hypothetical protein [Kineobactrum salinum]|uniref:Glycosyltransferase family 2 protein n=1 Tax=Kineobactrum salinum TaxID=2708301 RepID=A0A6C0U2Q0_9GAMM|nr:hypothetical protein [Kineobactrum salinum]QIB66306.1 hypothetical protein G3T16_13720 [Kineobactrum salinum]
MTRGIAWQRYRERHLEPGLPAPVTNGECYAHCVVVPAYAEGPQLLQRLAGLPSGCLVVLVINCPQNAQAADPNGPLRRAAAALEPVARQDEYCMLYALPAGSAVLVYDLEAARGPSPVRQGVGLARKLGCDLASLWIAAGAVSSAWIVNTDADARLPPDCFERLDALPADSAGALFPFWHRPCDEALTSRVTALYELRLHYYVLGLEFAASPCAHHSLGSILAVSAPHYAQVRGFPRRAAGEDFHLLNKLHKTGPVVRLGGDCVLLDSRLSSRVPFGTGQAARQLAQSAAPERSPLFYHPQCFVALRAVLAALPCDHGELCCWQQALLRQEPDAALMRASIRALQQLGVEQALAHCARQSRDAANCRRHFLQWFDALRSLRFIHLLRAAGWADLALDASLTQSPLLWPVTAGTQVEDLRRALLAHWGWTLPAHERTGRQ